MDIINNYIDSFLFHYNEAMATACKTIGLEYHYVSGWDFLLSVAITMAMFYFIGKSRIPEWIDRVDPNNRYSFVFMQSTLLGLIYLANGIQGILLLLCVGTLLFAFYYFVVRNEKYVWLKEMICKIF